MQLYYNGFLPFCVYTTYFTLPEIISIIASISTFTIDSIKNEFNIEIESLIESYVSEINNFLNNFFLEEMKDEYFKGK